jgi:hypothetical protein
LSSRSGTSYQKQKNAKQKPQARTAQTQTAPKQTQTAPKPKTAAAENPAITSQEAARKEARLQRQAQARAEAERKRRQNNIKKYAIYSVVALAAVAALAWILLRDVGKPGEKVDVMAVRNHLASATEAHIAYSTDPPTSGPHTNNVPAFTIYTTPIPKEEQVHGLEDGAVVINYQPDLDKEVVAKLDSLARLYQGTTGKNHVIMSPYPGLSNPIVLTSWGRIDRIDTFDEVRMRKFIDEYVNIDHHEGTEGQRL